MDADDPDKNNQSIIRTNNKSFLWHAYFGMPFCNGRKKFWVMYRILF